MASKDNKNTDIDLWNLDDINLDDINLDDIDLWDSFSSDDSNSSSDDWEKSDIEKLKDLVKKGYLTSFVVEKIEEEIENYNKPVEEAIKSVINSLSLVELWEDKESIDENNKEDYINWILSYIKNWDISVLENLITSADSEFTDLNIDLDSVEDESETTENTASVEISEVENTDTENDISDDISLDIDLDEEDGEDQEEKSNENKEEENEVSDDASLNIDLEVPEEDESIDKEEKIEETSEEKIDEWSDDIALNVDLNEELEENENNENEDSKEIALSEKELAKLTKAQLMEKLDELGIEYDKKLKKAELISLVLSAFSGKSEASQKESEEEIWWGLNIDLDEEMDTEEAKEEEVEEKEEEKEESEEEIWWGLNIDLDEEMDTEEVKEEEVEEKEEEKEESEEINTDKIDKENIAAWVWLSLDELESKVWNLSSSEDSLTEDNQVEETEEISENKVEKKQEKKKSPRVVPNENVKRKSGSLILTLVVILIWSVFGFLYVYFSYPELLWLDTENSNPTVSTTSNSDVTVTEDNKNTKEDKMDTETEEDNWESEVAVGTWDKQTWDTEMESEEEDTWYISAPEDVNLDTEQTELEVDEDTNIKQEVADLIKEYYSLLKDKMEETDDEEELSNLKKKTVLLKTILKRVIQIDEDNMTEKDIKYLEKIKVVLEKKIEDLKNE